MAARFLIINYLSIYLHRDVINNPTAMDTLEEDFLVYQAMSEADIPAHIWKESKVEEKLHNDNAETVTYHRMDMIWGERETSKS